jgi:hypothetical protein
MSDRRELADVLADARGEAAVLRRNKASFSIERVELLCDEVSEAASDYLRWLSEADARLKSGLALRTLRRRFRELQECGLARYNPRHEREFRACAIPPRPAVAEAREAARRMAS